MAECSILPRRRPPASIKKQPQLPLQARKKRGAGTIKVSVASSQRRGR